MMRWPGGLSRPKLAASKAGARKRRPARHGRPFGYDEGGAAGAWATRSSGWVEVAYQMLCLRQLNAGWRRALTGPQEPDKPGPDLVKCVSGCKADATGRARFLCRVARALSSAWTIVATFSISQSAASEARRRDLRKTDDPA